MKTEIQKQEKALFYSIDDLLNQNKLHEASSLLDLIPPDSPNSSKALFVKSMILGKIEENEKESFENFNEFMMSEFGEEFVDANEKYPPVDVNNPSDLFNIGLTNFYFGDYEKAIEYFEMSLKKLPKQSEVIYYKALSIGCLGNYKKAIRIINKAIEINPENGNFWNDKGAFFSELNQISKAHSCFNKSIALKATSFNWSNKGALYHKCGDLKKAMGCYDNAISLNSEDVYPVVGKAKIFMELDDLKSAEKYFDLAEDIDDCDLEFLIEKGKYMMFMQKYKEAIAYFDKCLKFNSELAFVWMFKSMALKQLKKLRKANQCVDRALEIDPDITKTFEEFF